MHRTTKIFSYKNILLSFILLAGVFMFLSSDVQAGPGFGLNFLCIRHGFLASKNCTMGVQTLDSGHDTYSVSYALTGHRHGGSRIYVHLCMISNSSGSECRDVDRSGAALGLEYGGCPLVTDCPFDQIPAIGFGGQFIGTMNYSDPQFSGAFIRAGFIVTAFTSVEDAELKLSLNGSTTDIPILGCTDPLACPGSYDPSATVDDNSCDYDSCKPPELTVGLKCSPGSQTVGVGATATLAAQDGDGNYRWQVGGGDNNCLTDGCPATGTGSPFSFKLDKEDSKTVRLWDGSGGPPVLCSVTFKGGDAGGGGDPPVVDVSILVICPAGYTREQAQDGCPGRYRTSIGGSFNFSAWFSTCGWDSSRACLDAWVDVTNHLSTRWEVCGGDPDCTWTITGPGPGAGVVTTTDAGAYSVNANYLGTGKQVSLEASDRPPDPPACNPGFASGVCGYFYNDKNNNGTRDAGEPGLPGHSIRADRLRFGVATGATNSTVTDVNGFYVINQLIYHDPDTADDIYSDFFQAPTFSNQLSYAAPSGFVPSPGNNGTDKVFDWAGPWMRFDFGWFAPAPTLDIRCDDGVSGNLDICTIPPVNTGVTLNWSSTNVSASGTPCTASGSWSGLKAASNVGTPTGPLAASQTYILTCDGNNGETVRDAVTVMVALPPVTVDVKCDSGGLGPKDSCVIPYDGSTDLTWTSSGLDPGDTCIATGDWAGGRPQNGGPLTFNNLTSLKSYTLTCTRVSDGKFELDTASVSVGALILPPLVTKPSASKVTVTTTDSNYCAIGPHATVGWTYSDPSGLDQIGYQVTIDNDGDPTDGGEEFESGAVILGVPVPSGGSGSMSVTGCSNINAVTSPQIRCRMVWGTNYQAWVRVENNAGVWSDWQLMDTRITNGACSGVGCAPSGAAVTSWTTPAHRFPRPNFTYSPANPASGDPVTFTDTTSFDPAAINKSWRWDFGDTTFKNIPPPPGALNANTTHTYSVVTNSTDCSGGGLCPTLTATDDVGTCTSPFQYIFTQKALPKWREVAPR